MTQTEDKQKPSRTRRIAFWGFGVVLVLVAGIAVLAVTSVGRTINLAPWVRAQLVTQFSDAVPDGSVAFEAASIRIERDLHPNVLFERIDLVPDDGGPVISLSEVSASLSYRKLLRGQIAPRDINLSGVFLNAKRAEDGEISLAFAQGASAGQGETQLGDLEAEIDRLLREPSLTQLRSVNIEALTLQFDDQRAGRSWTVDGGRFQILREGDQLDISTSLALLGGRDYVSTLELSYLSQIGEQVAEIGIAFDDVPSTDIATQSPALTWLGVVNAPISGALRFEIDENGDLGPLSAALRVEEGSVQPDGQVRPVPFKSASSHFTFDPGTNVLTFDELSVDSAWGRASMDGAAHLWGLEGGLPNELWGQFTFSELSGNPAGLFGDTVSIDQAQLDLRLKLDPFVLDIGQFLVQSDGQTVVGDGALSTDGDRWDVDLNAHTDSVDATKVVDWWPENAKPKTRTWLAENIFKGTLNDVNFALRSKPEGKPDIYLDFDFQDAEIRYVKTLPFLKQARGHAVWIDNRFVVTAEDGIVDTDGSGTLDVSGTSFVIPDTRIKKPPAEVLLKTKGSVESVLALLDFKPFEILSKAKLPTDLASGSASVAGTISMPLRKGLQLADVDFDIEGIGSGVTSDHFIPGKVISVPEMRVAATSKEVTIRGAGAVGALPVTASWSTRIGPEANGSSQIVGTAELSERTINEFNLGLAPELISGNGSGQFTIDLARGQTPNLTVSSDLVGLRMSIPSIGWRKSADGSASIDLDIALEQPARVRALSFNAPGLTAEGDIRLNPAGGMDRFDLRGVKIGNWFTGTAELAGRGAGNTPSVEVTSGRLDLRNLPEMSGEGQGGSNRTPIVASLDRVVVSDTLTLTNFGGSFLAGGGMHGEFRGRVNGGGPISGSLTPSRGRSAIQIVSTDAGSVLRSAELLKNASGGDLQLDLIPIGDESFDGRLLIDNVRIQDAPAFAELLNAVSVVGLLDQLGGEGILFSDVESRFRLGKNRVTIAQGSAAGPSMGISADGYYDIDTKQFDLQGVLSPLYVLNAIGRPIARKGEGLFGFNYNVRGTSENPRVSVNPLSVLTPGALRDIFRRRPPKLDEASE